MTTISDAGKALHILSMQHDEAEEQVKIAVEAVFMAQQHLRNMIDHRDSIQKVLNLTAAYMRRETK